MTTRQNRVSQLLKKEISDILLKDVSDPRIGFVSITDVEISPDLKFAKIFVSPYGDEEAKDKTIKGLISATSFIQRRLAENLNMKFTPQITFKRDNSLERAGRLFTIMSRIRKEKKKKSKKK